MRVLIIEAPGQLTRLLTAQLAGSHEVRLLAPSASAPSPVEAVPEQFRRRVERVEGDLLDPEAAWGAVRGVDAVIHTGELPPWSAAPGRAPEDLIDWFTRGTHVLLKAAVEAGVRRAVLGSTLDLFRSYPEDVYITEQWRPRPAPEPAPMARYLAEQVLREFVRDYRLTGTVLRLGHLVAAEDVAASEPDLMWLDARDAARAFAVALERDRSEEVRWTRRWQVLHICGDGPNPRFLTQAAQRAGWTPQYGLASCGETSGEAAGR